MFLKIVMIFENLTPQQVMSALMMESRQQWDIGQQEISILEKNENYEIVY